MAKTRKDVAQRQKTMRKYTVGDSTVELRVYEFPDHLNTYADLRKEYFRLAKLADDRIRILEDYSKRPEYEDILKFAYAKAMEDIAAYRGEDANRFKGGVPMEGNKLTIQSRINDVLKFLNSPSSTITGINRIYSARAKTLNEKYGMDLTWGNMADFFENDLVRATISEFASDTAMKMLGKYYRNKDEIDKIFEGVKNKAKIARFKSENTKTTLSAKQMRYLYEQREKLQDIPFK